MRRYLMVALWPAGLATIAAAAVVAARRAPAAPARPLSDDGPGLADPAVPADEPGGFGVPLPGTAASGAPPADPRANGTPAPGGLAAVVPGPGWFSDADPDLPGWRLGALQLAAISLAGGVLAYRVMELVGGPVLKHGPRIDVPVERWTRAHQVPAWASVVDRLNKVGSSWTTWAAAGTAGACLSTSWSRQKWLPPSVLASAITVDKLTTLALRRRFGRLGPPGSPNGTYPAGGPDRVVLFSGLIANMLWREYSGTRRGKALALGVLGGLAFNMSYCREYLSKHWLTDILSGLFYGAILYAPFALAIRVIAGPPVRRPAEPSVLAIPVQRARWQETRTNGASARAMTAARRRETR